MATQTNKQQEKKKRKLKLPVHREMNPQMAEIALEYAKNLRKSKVRQHWKTCTLDKNMT